MNQYRKQLQQNLLVNPSIPVYIHLCYVFKFAGANRFEITIIFNEFIDEGDYAEEEREELIDYLYKISNE